MSAGVSLREASVWRLAFERTVVRRALRIALVVGAVLIAINHGDRIVSGTVDARSVLKMMLTVVVPYVVSTVSSVAAMRDLSKPG
jgi:hypothetical protein